MILVIDNYDSFTYNLVQYLGEMGEELAVHRNDQITVDEVVALAPDRIIISPGPCTPNEAGISVATIRRMARQTPILGVCLGHQSIGQAFGGEVVRAGRLMHGKTSPILHDGRTIFKGCRVRLRQRVTTRCWCGGRRCRTAFRSRPRQRRERSWDCGIGICRWRGYSSTRSQS